MGEKEVKRQEIQKKVFYTEQTANQLITYYYYLGQIHQALDDHEKATLNFSNRGICCSGRTYTPHTRSAS